MNLQSYCELYKRCNLNYTSEFIATLLNTDIPPDDICILKTRLVEKFRDLRPTPKSPLSSSLYLDDNGLIIILELAYNKNQIRIIVAKDMIYLNPIYDDIVIKVNEILMNSYYYKLIIDAIVNAD